MACSKDFWEVRREYSIDMKILKFGGSIDLTGKWKFSVGTPDIARTEWLLPDYDDSKWDEISVPAPWEKQGIVRQLETTPLDEGLTVNASPGDETFNGLGLYRKQVVIPERWRGQRVYLHLGDVRDLDRTCFNGKEIGASLPSTLESRNARLYEVPPELISFGKKNTIALAVLNLRGPGGIVKAPVPLSSHARNTLIIEVYDINHIGGILARPVKLIAERSEPADFFD